MGLPVSCCWKEEPSPPRLHASSGLHVLVHMVLVNPSAALPSCLLYEFSVS